MKTVGSAIFDGYLEMYSRNTRIYCAALNYVRPT